MIATGYLHLDEPARVLGLSRSTTWTILHAPHKNSGLPASVIKQMLVQPQLPALVRIKLFEYVDEKSTGMYGHNPLQLRRFVAALSREHRVMQNDGALDSRAASRARPAAMPRS